MSRDASQQAVTLADQAIHNPDEPRHFMRLKPVDRQVRLLLDGETLAVTREALRLLEVGRDFYDPMLYLPAADVSARLVENGKTTRCPLKGSTRYFDLAAADGAVRVKDIAWSYRETLPFAGELKDLIAFDPDKVVVEESP